MPIQHHHPKVSKADVASLNERYAPWRIEKTRQENPGITYAVTTQARNVDTGEIIYRHVGWTQESRGQALNAILERRDAESDAIEDAAEKRDYLYHQNPACMTLTDAEIVQSAEDSLPYLTDAAIVERAEQTKPIVIPRPIYPNRPRCLAAPATDAEREYLHNHTDPQVHPITRDETAAVVTWCREWAADCVWSDVTTRDFDNMSGLAILVSSNTRIVGGLAFVLADIRRLATPEHYLCGTCGAPTGIGDTCMHDTGAPVECAHGFAADCPDCDTSSPVAVFDADTDDPS